ncbi:MAG: hypothetical protein AVDCRST_MAG48-2755 [uncultured Friedmanniella sp.]|uniref:Uncharacterized protein n=1 Tax=uncultured Friedmanniella sp. TaxID=335381 RepID=A0A6J4L776_9ACTN|nr:MAG: hypothetical protein AVDCRST_MAG48-2755 [uncultured Friedmanniella sp.]
MLLGFSGAALLLMALTRDLLTGAGRGNGGPRGPGTADASPRPGPVRPPGVSGSSAAGARGRRRHRDCQRRLVE